jgi:ribonuclease BN (tRNA processing enzyme)
MGAAAPAAFGIGGAALQSPCRRQFAGTHKKTRRIVAGPREEKMSKLTDQQRSSGLSRRSLLAGLAAAPALTVAAEPAAAQVTSTEAAAQQAQAALKDAKGTKLVLLGTSAGPVPTFPGRTRHMTSHVMVSNGAAYVLDCGLGVTNEYARTGLPFNALKSIFITHHHPDHNCEYGPLLLIGWVSGMPLGVRAFGPPPLKQMTQDFLRAYKTTIDFWAEDFHIKPLTAIEVKEIAAAGPVMQDDNVKVSSIIVEHPPVKPALGYRFDFKDRSIAFSGDTTPLEAVAKMAKGADVLVHEAMYVPAIEKYLRARIAKGFPVKFEAFMAHMKADHSPVEDVGRIAQEAGVKTLVLSHLTPGVDTISDDTWRAPAAKYFKGEIIVAHDLMVV